MTLTLDRLAALWFVQPGDVVYDIGTFIGRNAAMYLNRGAATVYAFEPLSRNRDRIPERLQADPRFRLFPCALSDRAGRRELIVPRRNSGGGSLSRAFFEQVKFDDADPGDVHVVDVRTLDELDLPPARFWKIDAEGSELEILRGADARLRYAPPEIIQVEIFLHDRGRYLETLNHLNDRFPYLWAFGLTEAGRLVHYPIDTETISSSRFREDTARTGPPHYYASSRPFADWVKAVG